MFSTRAERGGRTATGELGFGARTLEEIYSGLSTLLQHPVQRRFARPTDDVEVERTLAAEELKHRYGLPDLPTLVQEAHQETMLSPPAVEGTPVDC